MPLVKNGFLEKIETWHVGLSYQYTHFRSLSSKSEHDTVADQATLTETALKKKKKKLEPLCRWKDMYPAHLCFDPPCSLKE